MQFLQHAFVEILCYLTALDYFPWVRSMHPPAHCLSSAFPRSFIRVQLVSKTPDLSSEYYFPDHHCFALERQKCVMTPECWKEIMHIGMVLMNLLVMLLYCVTRLSAGSRRKGRSLNEDDSTYQHQIAVDSCLEEA